MNPRKVVMVLWVEGADGNLRFLKSNLVSNYFLFSAIEIFSTKTCACESDAILLLFF